jgi:hypothetical protein
LAVDIIKQPTVGPDHQIAARVPFRRRHKVAWVVVCSLLLLLLALGLVLYLRHREEAAKKAAALAAKPAPGITVTSATAQKGSIGVYLDAIGTVTPVYTASITSQVTGLVVAVHYQEGQLVQKDDPLVDIDPRPYRAMLLPAQGALPYQFSVTENGDEFTVLLEAGDVRRSVIFSLAEHAILVRDSRGKDMFDVTLTFNGEGECRLNVQEKERELWQVRRTALEELLFRDC